jgi:uncharacterized protein (DUF1330 family)
MDQSVAQLAVGRVGRRLLLARNVFVNYTECPHLKAEMLIPKAYWVVTYRSIKNPDALATYAKIAAPAIQSSGGRFLVRGNPTKTYEAGMNQRVVVIAFDSVAQAVAARDSSAYQTALKALGDGAERDIRIVEGAS